MDIENINYTGVDLSPFINYKNLKDTIINRSIRLPNDVEKIYNISIKISPILNEVTTTPKATNLNNEKLDGFLASFKFAINCIIEYSNKENEIGISTIQLIHCEYIPVNIYPSNKLLQGKVRNIYSCIEKKDTIYISIYYLLAIIK